MIDAGIIKYGSNLRKGMGTILNQLFDLLEFQS
jgi:hypothetical protein